MWQVSHSRAAMLQCLKDPFTSTRRDRQPDFVRRCAVQALCASRRTLAVIRPWGLMLQGTFRALVLCLAIGISRGSPRAQTFKGMLARAVYGSCASCKLSSRRLKAYESRNLETISLRNSLCLPFSSTCPHARQNAPEAATDDVQEHPWKIKTGGGSLQHKSYDSSTLFFGVARWLQAFRAVVARFPNALAHPQVSQGVDKSRISQASRA